MIEPPRVLRVELTLIALNNGYREMNTESLSAKIKFSTWWREAEAMPDRHYDPSEGVTLADHLEAVERNLSFLDSSQTTSADFPSLRKALDAIEFDVSAALRILRPVALLHDIGKVKEDKSATAEHPLTGKSVTLRHPVVGVMAAVEILPDNAPHREAILALIEEHDTPYAWYRQFQSTGQIPGRKSWAKLDRKIDPRGNGDGLILLALFKLADIDGHEDVHDVVWFLDQANRNLLNELEKPLPVPDESAVRQFNSSSD